MSVWEVCTKFRKRPDELDLKMPLDAWLNRALQPSLVRIFPWMPKLRANPTNCRASFTKIRPTA